MTRKYASYLLTGLLLAGFSSASQDKPADDPNFYKSISKWFSAWELVSNDIYHLDSFATVEFVFFDSQFVYSNSNITIPQGDRVNGPALLGHPIAWKRAKHDDSITMPDKSRVPVGLMSFAAEIPGEKGAWKMKWVKGGMDILNLRHRLFLIGKYENLKVIDEFFLTMEGLGQYTMYVWLTHKNGGNIPVETAIAGVRRGKKWWSQEEGFALFLVLEQLSEGSNWVRQMFGNHIQSILKLIHSSLTSKDAKH